MVADWIVRVAGAVGLPAIIGYFLVDRRRTRAAAKVAERTIDADVAKADTTALEAQFLALDKAFGLERQSYERQVRALAAQMEEVRVDAARRMEEVRAMAAQQVAELRANLAEVRTKCDHMRARLDALDPDWEEDGS